MQTVKYVHWQEGDAWLGYLQDYPDYWTQGETLDDLLDHLKDLYLELSGGHIPGARKVGDLVVPSKNYVGLTEERRVQKSPNVQGIGFSTEPENW